ncbi:YidC/Oxa1 family membrane protein insertase [Velocimicrobium porci]|uniref:YidC/Oxa1 family membrane protein insertase n=1 Tax=Velocimicrobium porci TaxID=2606634 RepID=A0A6L5XW55_9FIRM|nr:YidC/Oxa1 family membrane protein insertase [Velocimicrobium porci]MSS62962.1 YidC/Oxa1 family membrane protein insertase [Velocimicrobium porci]
MFNVFLTQHDGFILGPIAKLLGLILNAIFDFLAHFGIENAGLCIIVFTFLVNALMIPLTMKQQKFTKLSSKMNPEIMKVQEKYKGKKDEASLRKQQLEMQAIYEKYGANPTSGCLPMLITFPIMFALYRVIYNIPAYVGSIKALYENIAVKMLDTDYLSIMTDYAHKFTNLNVSKWGDISSSISTDHLIDIMSQFKAADWSDLLSNNTFSSIADVIQTNSDRIMHINNFGFGVNIAETPWQQIASSAVPTITKILYILIPVLAIVTQMLQTKLMMANTPQADANNPTAATMKSMNTIMPLMSGAFCLTLPVGVGIYWIAGAVFRSIQQVFVNRYMERMDVDELIEKNKEKQKKKKEKLGIDPNVSMEELAKTRTSSIKDKAKTGASGDESYKNNITQSSYKSGSIAANAHMLDRNRGDKEEK